MKKIIFTALIASASIAANAQNKVGTELIDPKTPPPAQEVVYDFDKYIKLNKTTHDFGKLPQGPSVNTEFSIKNISADTITISQVQPSCGCTVPDWTKTPIAPGGTGIIKATYNTTNRPGSFNKTLTIKTNRGVKPVYISGEVETLPVGSVPPAENMMLKHQ
jgi:hypothetical protein